MGRSKNLLFLPFASIVSPIMDKIDNGLDIELLFSKT